VVAGALSPGINMPGCKAYHSPPSSAAVMNTWGYTSTPAYALLAWYLVNHGVNFTFIATLKRITSTMKTSRHAFSQLQAFNDVRYHYTNKKLPFISKKASDNSFIILTNIYSFLSLHIYPYSIPSIIKFLLFLLFTFLLVLL
jgi:hypothetical protein